LGELCPRSSGIAYSAPLAHSWLHGIHFVAGEGKCSGCKERKEKLKDGKGRKQKGLTACVFSQPSKVANSNSLLNLALESSIWHRQQALQEEL